MSNKRSSVRGMWRRGKVTQGEAEVMAGDLCFCNFSTNDGRLCAAETDITGLIPPPQSNHHATLIMQLVPPPPP
ncbi:hypothetical protein E2C01_085899 [Portunus trituberculatus]|uniref:Uncharacterized protein n=1 Tax=Portunus trituberculatus TaxID=210409 RepID=A0A5B7J890_PORTR|nr:hypothetical protein [Portunus trituberculatus]